LLRFLHRRCCCCCCFRCTHVYSDFHIFQLHDVV
jgi:hypothetical protein